MSCRSCQPSKYSIEYTRQHKPENHSGCGVKASNDCNSPSEAAEGSALHEWEEEHGRLIYESERVLGPDGRWTMTFKKYPCPPESKRKERETCCSVRYRVTR